MPRRLSGFLPVLVLLLIALVYFDVRLLGYVWDDKTLFIDSSLLRNPQDLWTSISVSILPGTTYFRPLVLLSFIAEFKLFGVDPGVSHTVNLGIFLGNCALVGVLANRLLQGREAVDRGFRVALAMALYGLHPALLESTAWVAGRFDLLVTFLFLAALVCAVALHGVLRYLALALCLAGSLFSKEMAITFPVIFVLWSLLERMPHLAWRQRLSIWMYGDVRNTLVVIGLVVFGYLVVRHFVHPELYAHDSLLDKSSFSAHVAFVGQTLLFYIRMVIWPFADLNPMHPFDPREMSLAQTLSGVGMVLVTVSFAFYAAFKGRRNLLLILCALVAFLPVLNIIPLIIGGNIGHERFMALPMAFVAIFFAQVSFSKERLSAAMGRLLPWLCGGVVVLWLALCIMNLKVTLPLWFNENSLWRWAYQKHADFDFVRFNFVASLISSGKLDEAAAVLKAHEQSGGLNRRMKALQAQLLIREKDYEGALALLNDSAKGEIQPHLEVVSRGISLDNAHIVRDTFQNAWYLRFLYGAKAEAEIKLRRFREADQDLQVMAFYDPNYPIVYLFRAFAAYGMNRLDEGDRFYSRAKQLASKDVGEQFVSIRQAFLKDLCTDASLLICVRS